MAGMMAQETLSLTNYVLNNLDANNLNTMALEMIAIKIGSKAILEDVVELIYRKALSRPNLSGEYAELCAIMTRDQLFNRSLLAMDTTVLQVLLPKCHDVFYSYRRPNDVQPEDERTTTTLQTPSAEHYDRLVANSAFIAELYNKGLLPESKLWSFVMDLARQNSNAQVHCLATILRSAGSRLSKTYSLARLTGHMLILDIEAYRDEEMRLDLRKLIHKVKIQHAKFWIHEEPDRVVKENMRRVNPNLITPNKSRCERKEYMLNLKAQCALKDCGDLLSEFADGINSNESKDIKDMLSPALNALTKTNQTVFVVHMIATIVNARCPPIRAHAGNLLAGLVRAGLAERLVVNTELEKMTENDAINANVVSELQSEFTRRLNDLPDV